VLLGCKNLDNSMLTDWDEMSNLHRRHSIDTSYQVSVVAMFANRSATQAQPTEPLVRGSRKLITTHNNNSWKCEILKQIIIMK
jgi:uncharacterized lipoprotein